MKTLYININSKPISPSEELVVMDYDLTSDFFFYLGERIGKGCKIQNENALITDFNTPENKQDYDLILSQWNEVKRLLFSEEVTGSFNFELPSGYLHWLRYNEDYNHVYEANFSNGGSRSVTIDLEELYEDSVEYLRRKIIRKLNRDDLYLEIDEFVFNVEDISRKSKIVRAIKEKYEVIGFKAYKKWLQEHEEHVTHAGNITPDACVSNIKTNLTDGFRYKNFSLGETPIERIDNDDIDEQDGMFKYDIDESVSLIGITGQNKFIAAMVDVCKKLPKKWRDMLGVKFGDLYENCYKSLVDKKYNVIYKASQEIIAITNDTKYRVLLFFDATTMRFESFYLFLNECPYCGSKSFEIKKWDEDCSIPYCIDCNKFYWPQADIINESEEMDEDTPICPNCSSDDIDDDGSDYLQYTCNDCGHNWGHDDTIECPECGSNDIENDGTDICPYECNACGHIWGEDEEDEEEDELDFDHPLSLNDFFPVCGITLNKSTVKDAERQSHRYAEIEYDNSGLVIAWTKNGDYKGSQIRKEKNSNLFTTISTSDCDKMFPEWSKLGFDWSLSYNEWISLFKRMGFTIIQTQEPRVSSWEHGPDYFDAKLVTISNDNSLKFELEFKFGRFGSTHNSCSTLFNISVYSKDYCFDYGGSIGKKTFYNIEDFCRKEPKKYL